MNLRIAFQIMSASVSNFREKPSWCVDSLDVIFFTSSGLGNNVTITIEANDGVAGQVGFDERSSSVVVEEGSQVSLSVNRTLSAGRVSVDWRVMGVNASSDFVAVNGTAEFSEVGHIHVSCFIYYCIGIKITPLPFRAVLYPQSSFP